MPAEATRPRWDAALYAGNSAHHREFDSVVLEGVRLARDARVLDLGCGAGDFTRRLASLVPAGSVLGVDADPDMVDVATRAPSGAPGGAVTFRCLPAQRIGAELPAGSFDAVVTVATLHWVPATDQPGVLAGVARILRPGGLFRADFGGAGQIADVREILDDCARVHGATGPNRWYFPEADPYRELVVSAGFRLDDGWVRLLRQRRSMPDAAALRGWLRSQVLIAYDGVVPADRLTAFRTEAEERVLAQTRRADGSFDQDYVRMDVLAAA